MYNVHVLKVDSVYSTDTWWRDTKLFTVQNHILNLNRKSCKMYSNANQELGINSDKIWADSTIKNININSRSAQLDKIFGMFEKKSSHWASVVRGLKVCHAEIILGVQTITPCGHKRGNFLLCPLVCWQSEEHSVSIWEFTFHAPKMWLNVS